MTLFRTDTPKPVSTGGKAAPGTSSVPSRSDHVHPLPMEELLAALEQEGILPNASSDISTELAKETAERKQADAELQAQINESGVKLGDGAAEGRVALWQDGNRIGGDPAVTYDNISLNAPALRASGQSGVGERLVLAGEDGLQRAEDKLVWSPGSPTPVPWIGFWDMEDAAGNLTGGIGSAFTNACPGYPAYSLAPMDTTTPLVGLQSVKIPAAGLYARYATWTAFAWDVFTVAYVATDGVVEFGKSPTDAGSSPESQEAQIRLGAFGSINGGVRFCGGATVNTPIIPEMASGGSAHLAWVINRTALTARLYVNGTFRAELSVPAPAFTPSTIGCFGAFYNGTRFDSVAIVNARLSDTQIAELSDGVAWNEISEDTDGVESLDIGPDADLRVLDHAGTGQRMQTALPDGTLDPVSKVVWKSGVTGIEGVTSVTVDYGSTTLDSAVSGVPTWVPGVQTLPFVEMVGDAYSFWIRYNDGEYSRSASFLWNPITGAGYASCGTWVTANPAPTVCWVEWPTDPGTYAGTWSGGHSESYVINGSTWPASVTVTATQATADGLEIGPDAYLKVLDHAGTGQRMQTALPNGTFAPVAEARWNAAGDPKLEIDGDVAVQAIKLDIAPPTRTRVEGEVYWNAAEHCLEVQNDIAESSQSMGRETWTRIVNKTGAPILDGTLVYINGAQGNRPTVAGADASATSTVASRTVGVVTATIANNAEGNVTVFGPTKFNTSGFVDGDELWGDPSSPGGITTTLPVAPNHRIRVGYAMNSTVNGLIFVTPHYMGELHRQNAALREPTGFEDPKSVGVSYDSAARTITLTQTGGVVYWHQGVRYQLASPWTSAAHTATNGSWFLMFGAGGTFVWSNTAWDFEANGPVAYVAYNNPVGVSFGVRECHGLMPWQVHRELHDQIGTYRRSGGIPTAGTYVIDTSTNAAITPGFDAAEILDEDCPSTLPALAEGSYTHISIGVAGVITVRTAEPYLTRTTGTYPNWNNATTGADVEAATGGFLNVYQILLPATSDAGSQAYRMLFLQPQAAHSTLAAAQAEDFRSLSLGNLAGLSLEFVAFTRLTFSCQAANTTVGKVRLAALAYITGARASQTTLSSVTPTSHTALADRSVADQHPQSAITNLVADLAAKFDKAGGAIGVDPGGGDLLRVGGTIRATGGIRSEASAVGGNLEILCRNTAASGYSTSQITCRAGSAYAYLYTNAGSVTGTRFGLPVANSAEITGTSSSFVAYGNTASAPVILMVNNTEVARWTSSSMIVGTDPGGGELLRVGGGIRSTGTIVASVAQGTTHVYVGTPLLNNQFFDIEADNTNFVTVMQGQKVGVSYSDLKINPVGGDVIIGTDPGGSELLRVGGSARFSGQVVISGADFSMSNDHAIYAGGSATANLRCYFDSSNSYWRAPSGGHVWQNSAGANKMLLSDIGALTVAEGGVFGTDPSGPELLRVGGAIRAQGLVIPSGPTLLYTTTAPGSSVSGVSAWVSGSVSLVSLISSGAASNEKIWDIRHTGTTFQIAAPNDAYSASSAGIELSRSGAGGIGIGFLGASPVTRPTVTGSRGGNAALASLCTALANLGLITDSTS